MKYILVILFLILGLKNPLVDLYHEYYKKGFGRQSSLSPRQIDLQDVSIFLDYITEGNIDFQEML